MSACINLSHQRLQHQQLAKAACDDLSGSYMALDTYGERFQLQEDEGGFQSFLEIAEISMCGSWWSR